MRIGNIRSCLVRIHPLFAAMLVFLYFGGAAWSVAAFLAVLTLHEGAHFACAALLKIPVTQIELTPFGGSMQIPLIEALPPRHALALSGAGPACNFLLLCLSVLLSWRFSVFHPFLLSFIYGNLIMLCLNLLPVLPLDGGRMLLALLSKHFSRARLLGIFLTVSRLLALLLIAAGFVLALRGVFCFSLILFGVYLLYAAAIEEKTGVSRYLASFMARRLRFESRKTLPVQAICAASSLPAYMLINQLRPGTYHTVCVVDESTLRPLGYLHEEMLLSCILDHSTATLGEVLSPIA